MRRTTFALAASLCAFSEASDAPCLSPRITVNGLPQFRLRHDLWRARPRVCDAIAAYEDRRAAFLELADRFQHSTDPAETEQLRGELAQMTFGD